MKKYLKLLVAGLIFSLAACGGNDSSKPKPSQPFPSIPGGPSVSTPEPSVSTPSVNVENIGETMSRIDEIIKGYVPEVVDADIELPTSIEEYGIVISWHSQSPDVISQTGKYVKPLNDTTVILTATYEYKGTGVHKVEVKPTVYGYTDDEKLAMAEGEMSQPVIDATHTSFALIENIESVGATIAWTAAGSEYATINEGIFALVEDAFLYGAQFSLTATIDLNGKTKEVVYNYTIDIDYNLRLAKVVEAIAKPKLVDNKTMTLPLTSDVFEATISWSANDEEVVIEENTLTAPARAEGYTLVITGHVVVGEAATDIAFDYQVEADDNEIVKLILADIEALPTWGNATLEDKPVIDAVKARVDSMSEAQLTIFAANELAGELTEKLNSLLDKYIEIRGVQLSETKATWEAIEVATGYEITFTDLGKKFTVSTNEFVYADYGIPADSKYNVEINVLTGDAEGYIGVGEAITQFGTPSELPKVNTPVVTFNDAQFSWTKDAYDGATSVRVYVDGVLRREVPISQGFYSYRFNGIADRAITAEEEADQKTFVVQFVGNGTTHQSSEFYTFVSGVKGAGFALNAPSPYFSNGEITFASTDYNQGYEVRIDDFRSYYTAYATKTSGIVSIPVENLNLAAGTYELKVKTLSDNGGTPSPWSNVLKLEIKENEVDGPTNLAFNAETFEMTWDAVENAKYYILRVPSTGYEAKASTNSYDLSLAELTNGNYSVEVYAFTTELGLNRAECIVNATKVSVLDIEIFISETKLAKPTNIVADHSSITWDAVEGALSYEVVINGTSYTTKTNSFVFIDNNLPMNFDYKARVKAIAATIVDNSNFSEEIIVKYNLKNVALSSNGTLAEASTGNGMAAIDGNDGSRWESEHADPQYLIVTLNNIYTIYGLHVYWEGANAAEYTVDVSTNGLDWVTVYDYKTTPKQEARHDYLNLDVPVDALFVRINGTRRGTQWGYSIFTLEIYTIE